MILMPFKIKYQFIGDANVYACIVTYDQYINFKKLPIIQSCEIIKESQSIENYMNEIQKALDMAVKNDTSHIRNLSEIL